MSKGRNAKVPNNDAELTLLQELYKAEGELDTSDLIARSMRRFPILQTTEEIDVVTPSGRPWWPGRFRFDLSTLGKNGETVNIKRGRWRITPKGIYRLKRSGYPVDTGMRYESDERQSENQANLNRGGVINKPMKIEALLSFSKGEEVPPSTLRRFVESAARLLSIGTGIELNPGKRMTISMNEDGSLSLDISYNLSSTKPAGKDIKG